MKFKYTALNQDNKETTGVLEATNVEAAKRELHQMNLSILVINKISDEEYKKEVTQEEEVKQQSGIITYIFKAKDPYQKIIEGTIDAKESYSAFKRLITNYHFKVLALHPKEQDDLPDDVLENNFKTDRLEWDKRLKEEGINIEQALRTEPVDKDLEGETQVLNKRMIEQIDQFIIQSKGLIKVHAEEFSAAFLEEIKNKLTRLERIRSSNNIDNIKRVSNEVYELLSHPDRFASTSEETQKRYQQSLSAIEKNELIEGQYNENQTPKKTEKTKEGSGTPAAPLKRFKPAMPSTQTTSVTDWRFLTKSFWLYLKAPRGPLKEARHEAFKKAMEKRKEKVGAEKRSRRERLEKLWESTLQRDYEIFFIELNSFVGWLLAFYLTYLFLAGLSIEKGIGLPERFVFQTIEHPLIVNITLLLLWLHLVVKIKLNLFHKHWIGSSLLFAFSGVVYGMIIVNF